MDTNITSKALDMIRSRRQRAINENERHIEEVNKKIPQIKEINDALFRTGKELIRYIGSAGIEASQAEIERIKQQNLSSQVLVRKLLTDNGFPADYLDIHFTCTKCNDTGYQGAYYCDCFKKVCGMLQAEKLNSSTKLILSNFDTFQLSYYSGEDYFTMERIFNFAKDYAANFTPRSGSVLMFGPTGLGKTHLSLAIANQVIQKGFTVIYDSIINILRNIEKEHFSHEHSTEMLDMVMDTDLLILDDLGTEFETSFYNSMIYNIINTRLSASRPTIISTNMDFRAISNRYDERVVSRITSGYACLEFRGDDVRLQIKRNGTKNNSAK